MNQFLQTSSKNLQTSSKILQTSTKNSPKILTNHTKIKFSVSLHVSRRFIRSAPCYLQRRCFYLARFNHPCLLSAPVLLTWAIAWAAAAASAADPHRQFHTMVEAPAAPSPRICHYWLVITELNFCRELKFCGSCSYIVVGRVERAVLRGVRYLSQILPLH